MGLTNLLFGWFSNVLTSLTLYKEMAFIAGNNFSPKFFCPIFAPFCPLISFFHCFGSKLFFYWSSNFSTNCDVTSANGRGTDSYTFLLQICVQCVARFVGIFFTLSEELSIVPWNGFLLTTTLPFAFMRNRSSILFKLDDNADSCKTHTNQLQHSLDTS